MTNGEKLVKTFPDIELYKKMHGGIQIDFDSTWWNAEYKEPNSDIRLNRVKNELNQDKNELEPTTKNDLGVDCQYTDEEIAKSFIEDVEAVKDQLPTTKNDFKLKDYVSREAVRRIINSPRTQEQMLNALNSLRNVTECKAEDCINRDYTAKYVEGFANNEYVSQDEAETIYLIADGIRHIPSALPDVTDNNVGELTIHCKDCKFFEYDSVAKVDGMRLIVAHEICKRWGDGCKTKKDGYCFLFEPQEREEE